MYIYGNTVSRWILFRIRAVWDKSSRENHNTHFLFNNFLPENRFLYEIMWKNMVQSDKPQTTNVIWRMRFACWITKATDTHSEYVIVVAFPRQQWLRERASVLRYTYIACILIKIIASHLVKFMFLTSGSSFSIVTKLWAGKSRFGSYHDLVFFLFSTALWDLPSLY
jgi:hypothetical protein